MATSGGSSSGGKGGTSGYPSGGTPAQAGSFQTRSDAGGSYKVFVPTGSTTTTTTTTGGGAIQPVSAKPTPAPTPTTPAVNTNTTAGKSTFFTIGGKAVSANTILSNQSQYNANQIADALFATGQSAAHAAPQAQTAVSKLFSSFQGSSGTSATPSTGASTLNAAVGLTPKATPAYPSGGTPSAPVGGAGKTVTMTSPTGNYLRYFAAPGEVLLDAQGNQVNYLDYGFAGAGGKTGVTGLTTQIYNGQTYITPKAESTFVQAWQYDANGNRIGNTPLNVSATVAANAVEASKELGTYSPGGIINIGGKNIRLTTGYLSGSDKTFMPGQEDTAYKGADTGFLSAAKQERSFYRTLASYNRADNPDQIQALKLYDTFKNQADSGDYTGAKQTQTQVDSLLNKYGLSGMYGWTAQDPKDVKNFDTQLDNFVKADNAAKFADNPALLQSTKDNLTNAAQKLGYDTSALTFGTTQVKDPTTGLYKTVPVTLDNFQPNTQPKETYNQYVQSLQGSMPAGSKVATRYENGKNVDYVTTPSGKSYAVMDIANGKVSVSDIYHAEISAASPAPQTSGRPFGIGGGAVLGPGGLPTPVSVPAISVSAPTVSSISVAPSSSSVMQNLSMGNLNVSAGKGPLAINATPSLSGNLTSISIASPNVFASSGGLFGTKSASDIVGDIVSHGQVVGGGTNFNAVQNKDGSYIISVRSDLSKTAQADSQKYLDQAVAQTRAQGYTVESRGGGYYVSADQPSGLASSPGTAIAINPNPTLPSSSLLAGISATNLAAQKANAQYKTSTLGGTPSTLTVSLPGIGTQTTDLRSTSGTGDFVSNFRDALFTPAKIALATETAVGGFLFPSAAKTTSTAIAPVTINSNPVNQNLTNVTVSVPRGSEYGIPYGTAQATITTEPTPAGTKWFSVSNPAQASAIATASYNQGIAAYDTSNLTSGNNLLIGGQPVPKGGTFVQVSDPQMRDILIKNGGKVASDGSIFVDGSVSTGSANEINSNAQAGLKDFKSQFTTSDGQIYYKGSNGKPFQSGMLPVSGSLISVASQAGATPLTDADRASATFGVKEYSLLQAAKAMGMSYDDLQNQQTAIANGAKGYAYEVTVAGATGPFGSRDTVTVYTTSPKTNISQLDGSIQAVPGIPASIYVPPEQRTEYGRALFQNIQTQEANAPGWRTHFGDLALGIGDAWSGMLGGVGSAIQKTGASAETIAKPIDIGIGPISPATPVRFLGAITSGTGSIISTVGTTPYSLVGEAKLGYKEATTMEGSIPTLGPSPTIATSPLTPVSSLLFGIGITPTGGSEARVVSGVLNPFMQQPITSFGALAIMGPKGEGTESVLKGAKIETIDFGVPKFTGITGKLAAFNEAALHPIDIKYGKLAPSKEITEKGIEVSGEYQQRVTAQELKEGASQTKSVIGVQPTAITPITTTQPYAIKLFGREVATGLKAGPTIVSDVSSPYLTDVLATTEKEAPVVKTIGIPGKVAADLTSPTELQTTFTYRGAKIGLLSGEETGPLTNLGKTYTLPEYAKLAKEDLAQKTPAVSLSAPSPGGVPTSISFMPASAEISPLLSGERAFGLTSETTVPSIETTATGSRFTIGGGETPYGRAPAITTSPIASPETTSYLNLAPNTQSFFDAITPESFRAARTLSKEPLSEGLGARTYGRRGILGEEPVVQAQPLTTPVSLEIPAGVRAMDFTIGKLPATGKIYNIVSDIKAGAEEAIAEKAEIAKPMTAAELDRYMEMKAQAREWTARNDELKASGKNDLWLSADANAPPEVLTRLKGNPWNDAFTKEYDALDAKFNARGAAKGGIASTPIEASHFGIAKTILGEEAAASRTLLGDVNRLGVRSPIEVNLRFPATEFTEGAGGATKMFKGEPAQVTITPELAKTIADFRETVKNQIKNIEYQDAAGRPSPAGYKIFNTADRWMKNPDYAVQKADYTKQLADINNRVNKGEQVSYLEYPRAPDEYIPRPMERTDALAGTPRIGAMSETIKLPNAEDALYQWAEDKRAGSTFQPDGTLKQIRQVKLPSVTIIGESADRILPINERVGLKDLQTKFNEHESIVKTQLDKLNDLAKGDSKTVADVAKSQIKMLQDQLKAERTTLDSTLDQVQSEYSRRFWTKADWYKEIDRSVKAGEIDTTMAKVLKSGVNKIVEEGNVGGRGEGPLGTSTSTSRANVPLKGFRPSEGEVTYLTTASARAKSIALGTTSGEPLSGGIRPIDFARRQAEVGLKPLTVPDVFARETPVQGRIYSVGGRGLIYSAGEPLYTRIARVTSPESGIAEAGKLTGKTGAIKIEGVEVPYGFGDFKGSTINEFAKHYGEEKILPSEAETIKPGPLTIQAESRGFKPSGGDITYRTTESDVTAEVIAPAKRAGTPFKWEKNPSYESQLKTYNKQVIDYNEKIARGGEISSSDVPVKPQEYVAGSYFKAPARRSAAPAEGGTAAVGRTGMVQITRETTAPPIQIGGLGASSADVIRQEVENLATKFAHASQGAVKTYEVNIPLGQITKTATLGGILAPPRLFTREEERYRYPGQTPLTTMKTAPPQPPQNTLETTKGILAPPLTLERYAYAPSKVTTATMTGLLTGVRTGELTGILDQVQRQQPITEPPVTIQQTLTIPQVITQQRTQQLTTLTPVAPEPFFGFPPPPMIPIEPTTPVPPTPLIPFGLPQFPSLTPAGFPPFAFSEGRPYGRRSKRSLYASLLNVMKSEIKYGRGSSAAPEEYESYIGTAAEQNAPTAEQLHGAATGKFIPIRGPNINVLGGSGLRPQTMGTSNLNVMGGFGVRAPTMGVFMPKANVPTTGAAMLKPMPKMKPMPKPKGRRQSP